MLRGLPLVLILVGGVLRAHAEEPHSRFGKARPEEPPITVGSVREKREAALACSRRAAEIRARTTRDEAGRIGAAAWTACSDQWAEAAFEFAGAGQAINRAPPGIDPALDAFGKAADLMRADWYAQASAVVAAARRTGPPL